MEPLGALVFCIPLTTGQIPPAPAVVDAFVEAYNAHDIDTLRQFITEDAEMGAPGELVTGAQVLAGYDETVFRKFPSIAIRVEQRVQAGDMVAQTETITGMGEAAVGLTVYRVDRGCIVSMSISRPG
jgi:hypothetical protein